jgi:hypothetical protein
MMLEPTGEGIGGGVSADTKKGNYSNQADILFRKIGAVVAPNDAPPVPPGR